MCVFLEVFLCLLACVLLFGKFLYRNSHGHEEMPSFTWICVVCLVRWDQMCSDSLKNVYFSTRCASVKWPIQGNKYAAVVCSLSLKSISRQFIFINLWCFFLENGQNILAKRFRLLSDNRIIHLVTLLKAVFIHPPME